MPKVWLRASNNDAPVIPRNQVIIQARAIADTVRLGEKRRNSPFGDHYAAADAFDGHDVVLELRCQVWRVSIGGKEDFLRLDGTARCGDQPAPVGQRLV